MNYLKFRVKRKRDTETQRQRDWKNWIPFSTSILKYIHIFSGNFIYEIVHVHSFMIITAIMSILNGIIWDYTCLNENEKWSYMKSWSTAPIPHVGFDFFSQRMFCINKLMVALDWKWPGLSVRARTNLFYNLFLCSNSVAFPILIVYVIIFINEVSKLNIHTLILNANVRVISQKLILSSPDSA